MWIRMVMNISPWLRINKFLSQQNGSKTRKTIRNRTAAKGNPQLGEKWATMAVKCLAPLLFISLSLFHHWPWYLPRFACVGSFWVSFAMFFDPHGLKIIFYSHVLSLWSRNLQKCSKQAKSHIIEEIRV